jgi:flagellar basal body-associated protein FliL
MAKAKPTDANVIILACTLALILIAILCAGWYFMYSARPVSNSTYSSFGPMVVRSSDFSIKATFAVQTRNEDASWVKSHQKELNFALQTALVNADPQRLRDPEGLMYVQTMLRDAANTALNTRNIEEVLLTDFIVQGP